MNDIAIKNIDNIVEMYRNKISIEEIGNSYGMKPTQTGVVINFFKKIGVISDEDAKKRNERVKKETEKEIEERNKRIVFDYENFVDMEEMQEKYNLSYGGIMKILSNYGIKKSSRGYRNLEYPNNLIFDIFCGIDFVVSDDVKKGLYYSLNSLCDREKTVLKEYYEREKMLKEIGGIFNITSEQVRQIKLKALKKLRNTVRSKYIKYGYDGYSEMLKEKERRLQGNLEEKLNIEIEELGLSIRSCNSLKRAGINKVSDIKSRSKLMMIRGLGATSVNQVIEKLGSIGYEVPNETQER